MVKVVPLLDPTLRDVIFTTILHVHKLVMVMLYTPETLDPLATLTLQIVVTMIIIVTLNLAASGNPPMVVIIAIEMQCL